MKAHAEGKTTPQKIQLFKSVCFPTCKKMLKTFHATGESSADGPDGADGADGADGEMVQILQVVLGQQQKYSSLVSPE